jgi:hypothetical protein
VQGRWFVCEPFARQRLEPHHEFVESANDPNGDLFVGIEAECGRVWVVRQVDVGAQRCGEGGCHADSWRGGPELAQGLAVEAHPSAAERDDRTFRVGEDL